MNNKYHVEKVYTGRVETRTISPYDTFQVNPKIERSWKPSNSNGFEVVNPFYLFLKWILVRCGFLVPFTYTKEVETMTTLQRIHDQIRMHLEKYGKEPAVIFLGPKQEQELRREVADQLRPYDMDREQIAREFRVEKWGQQARTTAHALASMRGKQQFVEEMVRVFGPWVQEFAAQKFDYDKSVAFRGGAVLGIDYVMLPWIDGIVVVPRITGFGYDRRSDLMDQMGSFR